MIFLINIAMVICFLYSLFFLVAEITVSNHIGGMLIKGLSIVGVVVPLLFWMLHYLI